MLLFSHQYENIKSFRMTNGTKIENSNPDNCRPKKKKEKKVKILILIFSISTFRAKLLRHPPHSHNQKKKN